VSSERDKWIEENQQIIDLMFSGKLRETWTEENMEKYMKNIENAWSAAPKKRYLYAHSTLVNSIGSYFHVLGWDVGAEIPSGDLYSRVRFDLMAQKDSRTIVVEVKPRITVRELGQVLGYLFDAKKRFKECRVFLGTDILDAPIVFRPGPIRDIIFDNAQKNELSVIFAVKDMTWMVPAEFIF